MADNFIIQFLNSRKQRADDELQKTILRIHVISFHYHTNVQISKSSNLLWRYAKVRIWGAGIETTSVSLSRWRCSCCAWEGRWCTARIGEKRGMKGRHDRFDGKWRERGVHCEGITHTAGADRGRIGELWVKQTAVRVGVERKGRWSVGWCSGIIWRRRAIRSDCSLASLKRPLRIGEGSNECLFGNISCCTMLELGIIDSEMENTKSGQCCTWVLKMGNLWRNVTIWGIFMCCLHYYE